jgi:hypothetical protein
MPNNSTARFSICETPLARYRVNVLRSMSSYCRGRYATAFTCETGDLPRGDAVRCHRAGAGPVPDVSRRPARRGAIAAPPSARDFPSSRSPTIRFSGSSRPAVIWRPAIPRSGTSWRRRRRFATLRRREAISDIETHLFARPQGRWYVRCALGLPMSWAVCSTRSNRAMLPVRMQPQGKRFSMSGSGPAAARQR